MSTVMNSVAGKGRNLGINTWLVLLLVVGGRLRPQYRLRDLQGGAPGRRQLGGVQPAGAQPAAGQPGPRGGGRQRAGVQCLQGHQGADRRRHRLAQQQLRQRGRRVRPDRDRDADLDPAGRQRRADDRQRARGAGPGRQRRPLRRARAAAAGAAWTNWCARCPPAARRPRRSTWRCGRWCSRAPWPAASPKSAPAAPARRWRAKRWRATRRCSTTSWPACASGDATIGITPLNNGGARGRARPGRDAVDGDEEGPRRDPRRARRTCSARRPRPTAITAGSDQLLADSQPPVRRIHRIRLAAGHQPARQPLDLDHLRRRWRWSASPACCSR